MRHFPVIVACCSLSAGAVFAGIMLDAPAAAPSVLVEPEVIEGEISAVNTEAGTFSMIVTSSPIPITISVTEKTLYTLDGVTSTRDEALKAGNKAKVTHEEKVAKSVDASTPN